MDQSPETMVFNTVMVRARHAALEGWAEMPKPEAERRAWEAAGLFSEGPKQFDTHPWTRGFYATLMEDQAEGGSLIRAFTVLAQVRITAETTDVPPPPPDFMDKVMREPTEEEKEFLKIYHEEGIQGILKYHAEKRRNQQ